MPAWRDGSSSLVCSCLECSINNKASLLPRAGALGHISHVSGKVPELHLVPGFQSSC